MSTDIRCVCPKCKQHIEAPSDMAGTTAECPKCGNILAIPPLPPPIRINKPKKSDSSFGVIIGSGIAFFGIIFFVIIILTSKGKNTPNTSERSSASDTNALVADVSIEQVNTFPENYIGQSMVFKNCVVYHELNRLNDSTYYALSLKSKGGMDVYPSVWSSKIIFVVPKSIAEKMASKIEGGKHWVNCTIKCKIEKKEGLDFLKKEVIVALVTSIEVLTESGRAFIVFAD